jgi:hypothetical protein
MADKPTTKKPFLRYYTEIIPAGRKITKDYGGRWFICKESTAVFGVAFDDGAENPCELGISFPYEDEDGNIAKFKKVTLINSTAADIVVGFYISSCRVIDARLNTLVDRTINVAVSSQVQAYSKGTSGTLAAGASAIFTGLDGTKKRISFSVKNRSAADSLEVQGNNLVGGHECEAKESYGVIVGSTIILKNNSANPIDYRAMETFPV